MNRSVALILSGLIVLYASTARAAEPESNRVAKSAVIQAARILAPTSRPFVMPSIIPGVGNFARVSDVLYRGEQPTAEGFAELKRLGIKTVIDLRSLHDDRPLLAGTGLQYFRIYEKPWHPEDEDVIEFLKVVSDPANQPVFVHCQHGADRTGCAVAVYRMVVLDWPLSDALDEMHAFGFHPIWVDINSYLKHLNKRAIQATLAAAAAPKLKIVD